MQTFDKYLNPILRELDTLLDYSQVLLQNELAQEEQPYLQRTSQVISRKVKEVHARLKALEIELEKYAILIENETGDDKQEAVGMYNKILKQIREKVQRINWELGLLESPYFGKIVFNRDNGRSLNVYIGKFAYFDEATNQFLITDWRAPISNLYYTNAGPVKNVAFTSPVGEQKGDLTQKRMFEISNNRINSIYDAKSGNSAADSFLLSQLKKKIGKKLQDIVSTIQDEQNKIIRDEINKLTVIQGVAGSGKTTIVLHRLAYLFFAYQKEIRPERTLIIAPNTMFLDYISDVLPTLGVENVEASTYLFWAKKVLGWNQKNMLHESSNQEVRKYKGTREFLSCLIEAFEQYEDFILDNLPYSRKDLVRYSYNEIRRKNSSLSFKETLELAIESISIKRQLQDKALGSISRYYEIDETVMKKINEYVRKYTNPYQAYRQMLELMAIPTHVKKYTLSYLKATGGIKSYENEDLSAMVILHFFINGVEEYMKDYIIADEAQDMSYSQIYSLAMVARRNNLMLAGDLAQAIFEPVYIHDWVDTIDTIRKYKDNNLKFEYYQLSKSYRTTIEIIEFAKKTLSKYFPKTYLLPEAILRHGDEPIVLEYDSDEIISKQLKNDLEISNTVAVVCVDENHARNVYDRLKKFKDISDKLISFEDEDFKSGILVLPITKAKGLEFDSVYIMDVDANHYDESAMSIRRYYVASTRALHRLRLVISKTQTKAKIL